MLVLPPSLSPPISPRWIFPLLFCLFFPGSFWLSGSTFYGLKSQNILTTYICAWPSYFLCSRWLGSLCLTILRGLWDLSGCFSLPASLHSALHRQAKVRSLSGDFNINSVQLSNVVVLKRSAKFNPSLRIGLVNVAILWYCQRWFYRRTQLWQTYKGAAKTVTFPQRKNLLWLKKHIFSPLVCKAQPSHMWVRLKRVEPVKRSVIN